MANNLKVPMPKAAPKVNTKTESPKPAKGNSTPSLNNLRGKGPGNMKC